MKRVFKYPVPVEDRFVVTASVDAKPMCIMMQYGQPQLWMLVDDGAVQAVHEFLLTGTGHPRDDLEGTQYVGSVLVEMGLVFHLFYAGLVN
jgi:hypothetical protein